MPQNVLTVILGRKGTGKTTIASRLIRDELQGRGRVVVIDPVGEYPSTVQVGPFDPSVDSYLSNERFRLSIHPVRRLDLDVIIPKLLLRGRMLVVIDECHLFQDAADLPDSLLDLITLGRRAEVDQVWITQRPQRVHKDVLSQLDVAYLFAATEVRDLDYLGKRISFEAASKVSQLGKFEYLRYAVPSTYETGRVAKIPLATQFRRIR
jgi:DNA helicase HerA-like ATPase